MPVVPTAQQTDQWYALPFEERNKQTFDQWLGNTAPDNPNQWIGSPPATTDLSRLPASDFPGAANLTIQPPPVNTTPGGTGSEATTYQAPAAVDTSQYRLMGSNPIDLQTILGLYSKYLGRSGSQVSPDEVYFASGHPGGAQALEQFIANSDEAKAFAANAARPKVMPVPTVNPGTGGPPPKVNTSTPYNNSSQSLLLNAALQRLAQLQRPIDRTAEDAYTKMALDRVSALNGPPFTDTQNAALLTQHMAPLTQARDTAKQQAAEEMSRRGIIPSSGVFQDRMRAIDQAYERGVAGVTNTLNIQGIDATQKNAALQLQILDSLVNMGRMSRQEADQRSQEILQTAAVPFNTDLQTLTALTNASGDNASTAITSLLQLGGLNLKGSEIATNQNGQDAAAYGQVIGYIMAHHADFGF